MNIKAPFPERVSDKPLKPRRIVMVAFPQAELLDVARPLDIFAAAGQSLRANPSRRPAYFVEVAAATRGPLMTSSGIELIAKRTYQSVDCRDVDTLMISGGAGVGDALEDQALLNWIKRNAFKARRVASVCNGALLLAAAGVLDGRRATTHWYATDDLKTQFPNVNVEPDAIFVKDGQVYTSAGVTAGMDLALALVEEDLGREVALAIARGFVLFLKRPGGQSQFSAHLDIEKSESRTIRELQSWILDNLTADLRVEVLAARVFMSPRNFARVFKAEASVTPAAFIEKARLQAARRFLEGSVRSVKEVAHVCGFKSPDRMRRAFLRQVRVSPQAYRERFH